MDNVIGVLLLRLWFKSLVLFLLCILKLSNKDLKEKLELYNCIVASCL